MAWSAHEKMRDNNLLHAETDTELTYPKHPFSADLCRKLTGFPRGFREMALSRKLSIECIDYVHLMVLSSKDGSKSTEALSGASDEFLGRSGLTTLERLLATAVCAYNINAERSFITPNPLSLMYVEEQVRIIASSRDMDRCDKDVLEWACLMLRATTEKGTESWRWADTRLRIRTVSDARRKDLGEAFLPIPSGIPSVVSEWV